MRLPLILGLTLLAAQAIAGWRLHQPRGSDFRFHLASWIEVAQEWRHGTLYPRWAQWPYWGFGEPRFIFYPPASPMLGAALGTLLPWVLVPQAFVCLAVLLCGVSMYRLARGWLEPEAAAWAAVFFALNPYVFILINGRSAFAELLAAAFLPLVVLYATQVGEGRSDAVVPLALALAAIWLTNSPTAVLATYGLVFLLAIFGWQSRRARPLGLGIAAIALAILLASFYLIPAAYEMKWVTIAEILTPRLEPENNYLFSRSTYRHGGFNLIVSLAASVLFAITAMAALLKKRSEESAPAFRPTLIALAGACVLFMTPVSAVAWRWLPNLRYVQFPWRLLALFGVAAAYLVASAAVGRMTGAWRFAVLAAWAICGLFSFRLAVWKPEALEEVRAEIRDQRGSFRGGQEYLPVGCAADGLPQDLPKASLAGGQSGGVQVERWTAETRVVSVETASPGTLILRLFNYPAWHVHVNGREAVKVSWGANGLIAVGVPAGRNRVEVQFVRTADRSLGAFVSVAGVVLACGIFVRTRRSPLKAA